MWEVPRPASCGKTYQIQWLRFRPAFISASADSNSPSACAVDEAFEVCFAHRQRPPAHRFGNANAMMRSSVSGASKKPPPVDTVTTYCRPSLPR